MKLFAQKVFEIAEMAKQCEDPPIRVTPDRTGFWILKEAELLQLCKKKMKRKTFDLDDAPWVLILI